MALAVISGNKTDAMGAVMSLITVAHSLGMLFGSILAGMVMDLFDLQYAFYLGAGVMTAGTLVFLAGMYGGDRSASG
jgi:predicted MFS family arabinose efflux permease